MSIKQSYMTLGKEASEEFVINKSRFIGYGCPVESEKAALDFLQKIRTRHKDASHNCYGYIIGANIGNPENVERIRYSDDGEPSGTAGLPIIEVIKNKGIVNCAVVVTRYFGGILLGAGGLARAYTQGAAAACNASGIVHMEKTEKYICEVSYSLWDKVRYELRFLPAVLESTNFGVAVNFTLLVRSADSQGLMERLTSITDGNVVALLEDTFFHPWTVSQ